MTNFKSNAPKDYVCPICLGLESPGSEGTLIQESDILYRDDLCCVLINSFFIKGNEGHVIVVPVKHYESIYDLPTEVGHAIFDQAQKIARAMKVAYKTDGINILQNNEPAADQHAFHYHMHIFPRYTDDKFNESKSTGRYLAEPEERLEFSNKLREQLGSNKTK